VKEYNRVVLELNESAERLAQQEREGAWREMAKQVAHEIKNPLTPMKLSIQHLQRTVKQKPEDFQHRLDQTAKTLIQQIDTLSSIANAFSAFAKLPEKNFQQVELKPILETATNLYLHEAQIKLEVAVGLEEAKVFGDADQLLRLFNNLLKNAVHAIQDKPDGQIKVSLTESEKYYVVTILDNGIGIPKEQQERIFEPNFTTKSSGTGLGLAMAKSIVTQMEGEIDFTSEVGKGTRFQLRLMKLE
jgi:nitrogen fixation/metabolism regulation signal transduction histidine kinase